MKIGHKLKRLRMVNSFTQEELASRTDLSKGFISQIENDTASPSIATLEDILEVLGTTPTEFFCDIGGTEKVVYTKADRVLTSGSNDRFQVELLIPGSGKRKMDPVLVTISPNETSFTDPVHEGEEMGIILKGKISLNLEDNFYELRKGDCFYFSANRRHSITNQGNQAAKILWIVTPPIF